MIALLLAALLAQDPVPSDRDGENTARTFREVTAKAGIEAKIAALQEALKVEHEKVIKAVGEMLTTEADPVRIAAAKALGEVDHPASVEVLVTALAPNFRREDVYPVILKSIGELGWQSAAGRLNEMLSKVGEADVRPVLPDVLETLGQLGSAASIEPIIDLLLKLENGGRRNPWPNEGPMRRAGEEALRAITGQPIRGVAEWQAWWRANQEPLRAKMVRTFWVRKTQDRVDVAPGDKAPSDAVFVASRLHSAPVAAAAPPAKKKKKKST